MELIYPLKHAINPLNDINPLKHGIKLTLFIYLFLAMTSR